MDKRSEIEVLSDDQSKDLSAAPVILLMIDEFGDYEPIFKKLEFQGFRVAYTKNGKEGLRYAELIGPDLVLLELGMSGIESIKLCRSLKAQQSTHAIPVIFMIGIDQADKLTAGFEAGGVDYVFKPLWMDDLLVRIKLRLKLNGVDRRKNGNWDSVFRNRPIIGRQTDKTPMLWERYAELGRLPHAEIAEPQFTLTDSKSLLPELQQYRHHLERQNEALREARTTVEAALQRYSELFDFAPIAYYTLGRDGQIHQTNFRGASLLASECSAIVGQRFEHYISITDQPVFKGFLDNVFAAKDKQSCEIGLQIRGNPIRVMIEASTADTSRRTCLIAVFDISERKRVEAEKQSLLDILEKSADFIGCADLQGNLLYHNPAARRMVGLPKDADLSAMTINDIHPARVLALLRESGIPQVLDQGFWRGDSTLLHRDGREIPVIQQLVLHRNDDGQPAFMSTIMQDITERKRVEDVLKFIAQRGWVEGGVSFLSALAIYLARTLAVDYVMIDKLTLESGSAETVAFYAKEAIFPDRQYRLSGTPGENLLNLSNSEIICFPEQVGSLFPDFCLWTNMQVESYVALPLWDYEGKVIGSIAVMDGKPLVDALEATSLLQLVAASAAAELARQQSEKALAESWQFLNRVIGTIGDPVFVKDRQYRWILLNQAFCEFIGYPLNELLGKSDADFFPADEVSVFRSIDDIVFNSGQEVVNEESFTGQDGVTRTIVTKRTCYTDERGQLMLVGVIRDITERKRMEAQLTNQAQELLTLIENAPDTIARYDRDTRITYINPQLVNTLNKPAYEILGMRAEDRVEYQHPAFRGYLSVLKRVIRTGMPEEYLLEIDQGFLGRAIYDNIRFAPEFSENGRVSGVIAIGRDYSRQRQLELELARREQEFRTLAENSPDIIVRYDSDCRRIYVNRAYMVSLNATSGDALGKTPLEFWRMVSPNAHDYMNLLQRIMETGTMQGIEMEYLDDNGKPNFYATYVVPEYDYHGNVCSILSISREITALKATERHLMESRALLRALTAQREETREDERKRIARELHDELGQRLTALRMDIGRLRLRFGPENPALLEQVQEMLASLDATILVVRNVASALRPAVLDMGIASALAWLADDFGKRSGIRCDLLIPDGDMTLDDNHSTAIFRIVQESLTNVARHSQASKVRVILARQDDGYHLEIRDNGKGFDPSAGPKIGSFGLVGIEERVLMLGGKLTVDTSPGRGVKLSVYIANGIQTMVNLLP